MLSFVCRKLLVCYSLHITIVTCHLRLVEARGVVGVGELGGAPGQDLVDGETPDVMATQEPVEDVGEHRGAVLAPGLRPEVGVEEAGRQLLRQPPDPLVGPEREVILSAQCSELTQFQRDLS